MEEESQSGRARRLYQEWGESALPARLAAEARDWDAFRRAAGRGRTAFNTATQNAEPGEAPSEAAAAAAAWEELQPLLDSWKNAISAELEHTRKRRRTGQALQKAYGSPSSAGSQIDTKN
ncbi:MAG: hypothetical protein RL095_822 [Verrucomicrobiota bacterium]|jgi:hypothetical protein